MKLGLLNDSVSLNASVFEIQRQNVARFNGILGFAETVGEQRHRGFEIEVSGKPLPGVTLSAGYGYLDGVITQDPDPARQGSRPVNIPEHTGSVTVRYDFSSGTLAGLYVGGTMVAIGSRFLDDREETKIDGSIRGDLFAGYSLTETLYARLFMRNISNAKYIETPGSINGQNHFNAPFGVFGTLGVKF